MTLFQFDDRLAPVRTGRYADAATSFAWLLGLVTTVLHPAGLVVAGVLFALSATSVARAVAAASTFGVVVVGAGWLWMLVTGELPVLLPAAATSPLFDLPLLAVAVAALFVPPAVGGVVRAIG